MNKKLFLVLVLVAAILVTGAWVMAAKRLSPPAPSALKPAPADVPGVQTPFKAPGPPKHALQQNATSIPKPAAIQKKAAIVEKTGRPQKGLPSQTSASGTPVRLGAPGGKDLCVLAGTPAWFVGDWIYGLEWYANYQDPTVYGCTNVWPFKVDEIDFQLNFPAEWVAMDVSLQGFILADLGTPSCPEPGYYLDDVICSTLVYTYNIPTGGGYFEFPIPMTDSCCVNHPYFAAVYISTDLSGLAVDMVSEDNATAFCRSYNDYGGGWVDLVQSIGFPGPLMLYSQGRTHPQNTCPVPPADTCYVNSIVPATQTVLAGTAANYTANVTFGGIVTSCNLTVTPDPACPSCVTTVTPNPVVLPTTSATVTIQTSASTAAGTYTFSINGAKVSATLIVVAPNDTCEIARWITAPGYYYGGWAAGDQNAVLLDPASCIACGGDFYPFHIRQIKSRWVNSSGTATSANVIFHIYEATTPYCNGPGAEIYQFPATITAWSPNYVTVNLPKIICVDGPFWLAAEYVSVTPPGVLPSLRFSNQTYADTCSQFIYFASDVAWYEWADVWTPPPPGYYYLSAIGNCEGTQCPIECNMQQDNGAPAGYASWIWEGFQVAKYYNPEDYCEPPVYPYLISDVEFPLYKWSTAAPQANVQIAIYLECEDSCDGPGTRIYLSDIYNITSFYPNWTHIELPEPVCVWEPFFVAIRWAAGPTPMPSMLMDNNLGMPGDSCHQWFFDPDVPEWVEHHNWWGSPEAVGVTMLRVSGATNHFECVQAPCDTAVDSLAYYNYPAYIWALPSTSGRNYPNERFNMPIDHGGRLERIRFAHYAMSGDPDPCYYVWLSDGMGHPADNNPPYQAIGTFCIPSENVQFYPNWTVIQTYPQGIVFDPGEVFHVGYSFTFDPGDALNLLGDDYDISSSTRAGIYWPTGLWETMYEQYGLYTDWCIEAIVCSIAPLESTFTIQCSPSHEYAVPGDLAAVKYHVDVGKILNYVSPVTLSCTPPNPHITVSFAPNGVPPVFTSDVTVSADALTPYGDYTLSLCGNGADGQGPTCCDVLLTVQPPYDEAVVDFYHGKQRATNFGAVGNDGTGMQNFLWNGLNNLFDGSFIVATDSEHIALDIYNCHYYGWVPSQHLNVYYNADYNANIAYGNFYCDEAVTGVPGVPSEYDSVFIVGIMDSCVDFSIKIKVYYNPPTSTIPIVQMYPALLEDWDVGDAYNNRGGWDQAHNLIYEYDPLDENLVFGIMKAPFDDNPMYNMWIIPNPYYVWPGAGYCGSPGTLGLLYDQLISKPGFGYAPWPGGPATYPATLDTDFSILVTAPPVDLLPGQKHIEVWIDFGKNLNDGYSWSQWWHKVLRYAGFYRGDVNASDTLELPAMDVSDLVYLMQYLFMGGPAPKPYADQGDVNGSGCIGIIDPKQGGASYVDITDAVYLLNYIFKNGPAPIDYLRFIPQCWSRTSLFENPTWQ
jgi:hypothetical protein